MSPLGVQLFQLRFLNNGLQVHSSLGYKAHFPLVEIATVYMLLHWKPEAFQQVPGLERLKTPTGQKFLYHQHEILNIIFDGPLALVSSPHWAGRLLLEEAH